jgi:hypothetical protein
MFAVGQEEAVQAGVVEAHNPRAYIAVVKVAVSYAAVGKTVFGLVGVTKPVVAHTECERTVTLLAVVTVAAMVAQTDLGRRVSVMVAAMWVVEGGYIDFARIAFVSVARTLAGNGLCASMYWGCNHSEIVVWQFENYKIQALIVAGRGKSCFGKRRLDERTEVALKVAVVRLGLGTVRPGWWKDIVLTVTLNYGIAMLNASETCPETWMGP